MIIGGIDSVVTTKLQTTIIRKESESRRYSDRIRQRQSNQKLDFRSHNEENNDEEYNISN